MKKKSLMNSSPYTKNRKTYEHSLTANVTSSSAIEGIHVHLGEENSRAVAGARVQRPKAKKPHPR